jgi:Lrp/AsnC family transcriptional regulator, leucine-responsive regulatory protein
MFLYQIVVIITIMKTRLDEKDIAILALIQNNSRLTAKEIARKISIPITTVFAKTKKMEDQGIIKGFKAILAPEKLDSGTAAIIFASVSYGSPAGANPTSQRVVAEEISKLAEVQEVHIITGDWDLMIKLRAENVDAVGRFVVDKLRCIKGIEKTLTCMIFETVKETTAIALPLRKSILLT